MYPTKEEVEQRLKTITTEIEALYQQERALADHIKKLEHEKVVLDGIETLDRLK